MRTSAIARLVVMGALLIALLVPLSMVQSVVSERASRRGSVVDEVSATWGGVADGWRAGPDGAVSLLMDRGGREAAVGPGASLLPARSARHQGHDGAATAGTGPLRGRRLQGASDDHRPVRRGRTSPASDRGRRSRCGMRRRSASAWPIRAGIARRVVLKWNGGDVALVPGVENAGLFASGLHAAVGGLSALADGGIDPVRARPRRQWQSRVEDPAGGQRDDGAVDVDLAASELHRRAAASVSRSESPPVSPDAGTCRTSGAAIRRAGRASAWMPRQVKSRADASAVGVSLLQPVDIYQQAERAVKYAALFIVMTFVVFFLWEIVRSRLLHPIQYLFVGFAMCVFYLLLVSISEHIGFDLAYASAAGATTLSDRGLLGLRARRPRGRRAHGTAGWSRSTDSSICCCGSRTTRSWPDRSGCSRCSPS